MIRETLIEHGYGDNADFRNRGGEVKRIEGFSDAVFAFAITLLVISLEVPKTFSELVNVLWDFPAFVISFWLLLLVWRLHYNFFRRYGLEDRFTASLNGLLLMMVLFFVFPLKFLSTFLTRLVLGQNMQVQTANGGLELMMESAQIRPLMIIYSLGYAAVFMIFALFYLHAYRQRRTLQLNEIEAFLTRQSVITDFANVGIGVLGIVMALVLPAESAGWAGYVFFLVGVMRTIQGFATAKQRRRILQQMTLEAKPKVR